MHAAIPDVSLLSDASLEVALAQWLEARRSGALIKAPRQALVREIAMTRRLQALLERHLNVCAAKAYSGRHPKHWLWRSHKRFFLDRVKPGDRVLDIGCGASAYLLWMAQHGCKVTGCDRNAERIDKARAHLSHPNLQFEVRDVERDPPIGQHDVAVCSHVIEHLQDPVALLRVLAACAPRLLVAVPRVDSRWEKVMLRDLGLPWMDDLDHKREYDEDMLRSHMHQAGWRVVAMHEGIDLKAEGAWET